MPGGVRIAFTLSCRCRMRSIPDGSDEDFGIFFLKSSCGFGDLVVRRWRACRVFSSAAKRDAAESPTAFGAVCVGADFPFAMPLGRDGGRGKQDEPTGSPRLSRPDGLRPPRRNRIRTAEDEHRGYGRALRRWREAMGRKTNAGACFRTGSRVSYFSDRFTAAVSFGQTGDGVLRFSVFCFRIRSVFKPSQGKIGERESGADA